MTTKADLRRAALAMQGRRGLKNFLHDHAGLSLAEASEKVSGVVASSGGVSSADTKPLSRAGIARATREFKELQQQRFDLLYSQVQNAAHAKWIRYDGPLPDKDCWVTIAGRPTVLEPWKRIRHGFALELVQELEKQLDGCSSDDEKEAVLVKQGWTDDLIERYLEVCGKGENDGSNGDR